MMLKKDQIEDFAQKLESIDSNLDLEEDSDLNTEIEKIFLFDHWMHLPVKSINFDEV